jgi:hypothetical protein
LTLPKHNVTAQTAVIAAAGLLFASPKIRIPKNLHMLARQEHEGQVKAKCREFSNRS